MRVELVNGRHLLCGGILHFSKVEVGQVWAPASGGNTTVTVIARDRDWVTYEGAHQPRHTKEAFAFQCRYCLVLPSAEIPVELLQEPAPAA